MPVIAALLIIGFIVYMLVEERKSSKTKPKTYTGYKTTVAMHGSDHLKTLLAHGWEPMGSDLRNVHLRKHGTWS